MSSYFLPLASREATLERAGGKGSNLSELVRAGFPVPPGLIVTTDAYRAFIQANRLQPRILTLVQGNSPEQPDTFENAAACDVTIHPDGSVLASIGTQDLGVGTRTIIAVVVAETLGLPLAAVQVQIGRNSYPAAGASGGRISSPSGTRSSLETAPRSNGRRATATPTP